MDTDQAKQTVRERALAEGKLVYMAVPKLAEALLVTPDEVIQCGQPRRPAGLYWDSLSREKIEAIPVLAALANGRSA